VAPLTLKVGIMTPTLFMRTVDRTRVEVAFKDRRGIATLPPHINAAELKPGTLLDVKILDVSRDASPFSFKANVLNVIDKDMLTLMFMMHQMYESASVPKSAALDELRQAIGRSRVTGNILECSKFTSGKDEPYLSVTIGYKNLRTHGRVDASFEEELEKLGKNNEITMEILSVDPEPKTADDFAATVFIAGRRQTLAFDVGPKSADSVHSSADIITMILVSFPLLKSKEISFSEKEKRQADTLADQLFDSNYISMAKPLCTSSTAEEIFGTLFRLYTLMGSIYFKDKEDILKEILNAIADVDLSMIHSMGAFFKKH
jgi:hypothetical protein